MPSREEMFFLRCSGVGGVGGGGGGGGDNQNNHPTPQDFLSRDIENLVSHIKENLRLSGYTNKQRQRRVTRLARPSPYSNPSRSLSDFCESCAARSDLLQKAAAAAATTTSTTTATTTTTTNNVLTSSSSCPHHHNHHHLHLHHNLHHHHHHHHRGKTLTSSGGCCSGNSLMMKNVVDVDDGPDDPYEMLQDLLRDGGLIKEAVRRLQKGFSPKQRYYSDSDEESTRTPLHLYQNLEV